MAAQGNCNVQAIDIDQCVCSLEKMLEDVPHYMCTRGHPGRLSRIPENLREVDAKAYEPYLMSIGPYHHGKPQLENMEKKKMDMLKYILEQKKDLTLKDYLMEMKNIEKEARNFYSDFEMETEEFLQIMLLDSLFIVTAFSGMPTFEEKIKCTNMSNGKHVDTNERMKMINQALQTTDDTENMQLKTMNGRNQVAGPRWFWYLFLHDIFLLENQIPFFVLEKVHDLVYGNSETSLRVSLEFEFRDILCEYTRLDSDTPLSPTEEVHHLLHLCHMFFRPTLKQESTTCQLNDSNQMFRLDSARQLYETGVTFEARSGSTEHSLLDVTFTNSGKMSMPCLCVDDNTESLLRNLIALEQMKYPNLGLNVSAYAVLLLHLITVPDDVKLLRRKGIIHHHLPSDKEMVYFINRLSVGLAFDYLEDVYSLKPVFRELKNYSNRKVPRWRAWLKHRYFNNPWTMISLFAASLLLFLSGVETYYTIYSYYHPYIKNP